MIDDIHNKFKKEADLDYARWVESYLRNKFKFFGVKAPQRRKITKSIIRKTKKIPRKKVFLLVGDLWTREEREYQYFALDILKENKKRIKEQDLSFLKHIIITKSWWDSVDLISKIVGYYFKKYPKNKEDVILKWSESENIWLRRTTLIFQLNYGEDIDKKMLFNLVEKMKDSEEFFIQKAIGWSLREYSKRNPEEVKNFVEKSNLSSLSRRESLKKIDSDL